MKKIFILVLFLLTLSACDNPKEADIVTTMYVQYDIVSEIVQDEMSVSLIIPAGAEVHGFEPSTRDIDAIKNSKLFIYTSLELDYWIKNLDTLKVEDNILMNLSESYVYPEDLNHNDHEHKEDNTHEEEEHNHDHGDLHYWTDPLVFLELINAVLEKIIEVDPENEEIYRANASIYYDEIHDLHHELDDYLSTFSEVVTIYFAGHNGMDAFGKRYNIDIITLSNTSSPDADITSAQLNALINQIKSGAAHYLFIEELTEPKVANMIKRELAADGYDLELLLLHGYHNISKDELAVGVTYGDLLKGNVDNIKEVLGSK